MASKMGNKFMIVDGIQFHSRKEGRHYLYLLGLQNMGEISDLKLQVPFNYMSEDGKKKLFAYKADFTYLDELGHLHIIDVKGFKTAMYNLKKKLIEDRFKIKIEEV